MIKHLLNRIVTVLLAISVLGGGQANAQTVTSFTPDLVVARLAALGIPNPQVMTAKTEQETHTGVVFSWQGATHIALLRACKPSIAGGAVNCYGLYLSTPWRNIEDFDPAYVNAFNATHDFGKAYYTGQTVVHGRYVISDGGISTTNLDSNIANFLSMSQKFGAGLSGGFKAVSAIEPAIEDQGPASKQGDEDILEALQEVLGSSPAPRLNVAAEGDLSPYSPVLLHDGGD